MPRARTLEMRDEILDAAASIFSARDFHDVLTDEIAVVCDIFLRGITVKKEAS